MNPHRAAVIAILFIGVLIALVAAQMYLPESALVRTGNAASVILTHTKSGNEHLYSGEIPMDAPCDVLSSGLSVAYGKPPQAKIALTTLRPKGAVCVQRKTPADFSISLVSAEVPQVSLTFDGMQVPVHVVEK